MNREDFVDKKIDNREFYYDDEKGNNNIDNKIYEKKNKLKEIDNFKNTINNVNKTITDGIDLLRGVKNKTSFKKIEILQQENVSNTKLLLKKYDEEYNIIQKEIKNLYKEKEIKDKEDNNE